MRALVIALVALIACDKRRIEPTPAKDRPGQFVPESVLSRLGDHDTVLAIDVARVRKGNPVSDAIPGCTDAIKLVGTVVIAYGNGVEGYISNLPMTEAKMCIDTFAPKFGLTVTTREDGYDVATTDSHYAFTWFGTTVHLTEAGHPPAGKLSPELSAMIGDVPEDMAFWFVSTKSTFDSFAKLGWARIDGSDLELTIKSRGTPEESKSLFDDVTKAFEEAQMENGNPANKDWFKTTADTLVLRAPLSAVFRRL